MKITFKLHGQIAAHSATFLKKMSSLLLLL